MFLAALAATAQTRMSVDSCMRYAANHNLDVRAARISLSDSRLDQQSALASTLPSVGAQIGAQFSFGRSIDPATNTYNNLRTFGNSYGLNISVPLFTGGSLVNDFRSARAAKRQAESEVDAQRDNASIAALDACINLLYCQELSKIMDAKHRESLDALKQTRRMKELGLKSAVDLSQSEAQEADDDYCLTSALAQLRSAELKLKSTMNFPLADSLSVEMPATGAATVSNGLLAADNPLLRQAEANVETQRLNALSARGRLMPSIFLNAGISDYYYSHQGQTNESFGRQMDVNFGQYVGVSVSIPLFNGLSRINGYRKARNRYVAAQIALERQRLQLDTDFSQAVIDRDNFAKEIVKMERKVDAVADDAGKLADLRVDVARCDHDGLVAAQGGGIDVRLSGLFEHIERQRRRVDDRGNADGVDRHAERVAAEGTPVIAHAAAWDDARVRELHRGAEPHERAGRERVDRDDRVGLHRAHRAA